MSTGLVIPAHVAEKLNAPASEEVCGTCRWRYKGPQSRGDIECRAHPPTVQLLMVPAQQGAPLARPGMQAIAAQPFTVYPIVRDDQFCGEWTAKP